MNINTLASRAQKIAVDNSPLILTAIGVSGTVATAILAGKATVKAVRIIELEEEDLRTRYKNSPDETKWWLDNKDKFLLVWPQYIPAVTTGALTITAIIAANRIGTRRAVALAGAYSLLERANEEYREKIIEKLGPNKERAARDELAQDRMNRNPSTQSQIIITGSGDVPCYDVWTGRYFRSDMETIKKAMNDINYKVNNHNYASLNDFYNLIGLPNVPQGEELGWSDKLLEIFFSTTMTDKQEPAISIEFLTEPIRNYFRVH